MVSIYQSATAGEENVAQISVSLQKTSVTGDLVLIVVQAFTDTAQVAAVTDNYGNQYQRIARQSTTTDLEIWYGV
ncbi:hypothetical protein, partial [Methanocella conradii]|uniref:hypothetical protein n=1 Tax=Methanocella conradii TaxID=1175444 RepID=UPI001C2D9B5A